MLCHALGKTKRNAMSLEIDCAFDGGNIEPAAMMADGADLTIRKDSNGNWYQWFYFRVRGGAGRDLTLRILNAGQSSYPEGWSGYRACVSSDNAMWTRAETAYADGVLEIRHRAQTDETWFAFFAPYSMDRHRRFVEQAAAHPGVTGRSIGKSVDGLDIACLSLGEGPRQVWLLGRQHSGETMASWWMEGAFARLTDPADPVAARLLKAARIHLVPTVNVDGAARGNLRGNAAGVDLNRQWHKPDPKTAPEVAAVLVAMDRSGVDLCLDIHGDETIPHVFIDGCDADPAATAAQIAGVQAFKAALLKASPAFQAKVGYPVTYGGDEAPGMCCRAVARRYGGIGMTLEMPFKDSLETPDPIEGWSPRASAQMGRDCLGAVLAVTES
jgi:murein tripeptide amidase MpaA